MKIERTRTYIRFCFWFGFIQFNTKDKSTKASYRIIDLAQDLSDTHLNDMANYLEALYKARTS